MLGWGRGGGEGRAFEKNCLEIVQLASQKFHNLTHNFYNSSYKSLHLWQVLDSAI